MNILIPPNIKWLSKEDYDKLLKSGMLWEYYPEATGDYFKDMGRKRMEIDIRNTFANDTIDTIRFGDSCFDIVSLDTTGDTIHVCHQDSGELGIKDIDNLIKALKKAKELWGGSDGN